MDCECLCVVRSEEHTSELQSHLNLVCRLLLDKKNLHSPHCAPSCPSTAPITLAQHNALASATRSTCCEHPSLAFPSTHSSHPSFFFQCTGAPQSLPSSPTRHFSD